MDYGMKFTFHQDTPVVPPDMMRTVSCAVNRVSKTGQSIGADEKISVLEALKAEKDQLADIRVLQTIKENQAVFRRGA
nr:hypothetical protein [uncultured Blautia sp.]